MKLVTCHFLLRNYETHNEESPWHVLFMAVSLLFWYLQSTLWYFQHCQWWCVFSLFQMTPLLWAPALSCCLIFVQGVQLVCCYMLVIPAGARATISVYTCSEERWSLTLCHFNEATSVLFFSGQILWTQKVSVHKLLRYCWALFFVLFVLWDLK